MGGGDASLAAHPHSSVIPFAIPFTRIRPMITRSVWKLVLAAASLAGVADANPAQAQQGQGAAHATAPVARAVPLEGAISVDGRLDEPGWAAAPATTAFTQLDPDEGAPASERTEYLQVPPAERQISSPRAQLPRDARAELTRCADHQELFAADSVAIEIIHCLSLTTGPDGSP